MLEFALVSIPLIFAIISLVWVCIGMWQYHTLAEAVNATARYASVHGGGCAGQTCSTTVEQIAGTLAGRAIGIPAGSLNVTLTSSAGNYTCDPLSSCYTNANVWPSLSGNTSPGPSSAGTDLAITATYRFISPISMWVPGGGVTTFGGITFGINSTQPVLY
jgi:Flp pilus assembly protein TadG